MRFLDRGGLLILTLIILALPVNGETRLNSCKIIDEPGYYLVDVNITTDKTKCFEIKSSDVLIDGSGHKIEAGKFGGTYAVYIYHEAGLSNITVKNFLLENWTFGISLRDVVKARIEGVNTNGGFFGIYSSNVADLQIKDYKAYNLKRAAFSLEGVKTAELSNLIAKNSGYGILITNSAEITIFNSLLERNSQGIYLENSERVEIKNSSSAKNDNFGLYIYNSERINASGLEVFGNKLDGIKAYNSNSCRITSSVFDENRNGIFLENSENFRVIDNKILNSENGIFVSNSKNNHFTHNELSKNKNGIVSSFSSYNLFNGNKIFGGDAITFHKTSLSTITNNWIEGEKGIFLLESEENLIYLNYLFAERNAYDNGKGNLWYSPKLKKGNFYSDYRGKDVRGDGIGDEDYIIPPNDVRDIYPLMKPIEEGIEEQISPAQTPEVKETSPAPEEVERVEEGFIDFTRIEFIVSIVALVVIATIIVLLKREKIL
jgi:parallel beta-helix repeat protein